MDDDRLSLVLANEPAEVRRVIERVETFCRDRGAGRRTVHRFSLALDEVLTNVVAYAFADGLRHEIEVAIEFRDGRIAATVSDDGAPFDPLSQPPPDVHAAVEDRKIGGLGIHLLRSLTHAVEYRRESGRNRLAFTVLLDAPERR